MFRTFDDVSEWVNRHSVEELRDAVASPITLHPRNRSVAAAWLLAQEQEGVIEREDEQHEFMRRQTVAAESSARSARTSARWAVIGGVVAAAMLIATAWPYFKLLEVVDRLSRH